MARGRGCGSSEKAWTHVLESCRCSYDNITHIQCQLNSWRVSHMDLMWECKRNAGPICRRAVLAWAEDRLPELLDATNDPACKRLIPLVEGFEKSCFILKESSLIRGNNVDYEVCHVNIKIKYIVMFRQKIRVLSLFCSIIVK